MFGVFCRRWGVPLIDGGTVRLPRIVGQGHAMDMILTGRPVHADEALRMGLANRVVDDGEGLESAQALAHSIAGFPQRCLRADRLSAYQQWDQPLADALAREGAGGYPIVFEEAIAGANASPKAPAATASSNKTPKQPTLSSRRCACRSAPCACSSAPWGSSYHPSWCPPWCRPGA